MPWHLCKLVKKLNPHSCRFARSWFVGFVPITKYCWRPPFSLVSLVRLGADFLSTTIRLTFLPLLTLWLATPFLTRSARSAGGWLFGFGFAWRSVPFFLSFFFTNQTKLAPIEWLTPYFLFRLAQFVSRLARFKSGPCYTSAPNKPYCHCFNATYYKIGTFSPSLWVVPPTMYSPVRKKRATFSLLFLLLAVFSGGAGVPAPTTTAPLPVNLPRKLNTSAPKCRQWLASRRSPPTPRMVFFWTYVTNSLWSNSLAVLPCGLHRAVENVPIKPTQKTQPRYHAGRARCGDQHHKTKHQQNTNKTT